MVEDLLRRQAEAFSREFADHDPVAFTQLLAARIADGTGRDRDPVTRRMIGGIRPAPVRPAPTRGRRRRRPTPILDQATAPAAVLTEARRLCHVVLRSKDIDTLGAFAADYDAAGARTFACLLYTLDKWDSALYWWRFAAGAGDELAAHLLAVHHAAVGRTTDARLWRTIARMMGFAPDRHLPVPVRGTSEPAQEFARTWDGSLQTFLRQKHLPRELALG
ncbi:hypothetical protein SSP35_19_00560 [Streptomyces sp. NBRC 110611]|uniref:hypothetical protein n=1 Tax=Streptomyces sp. NBRC 110611 TaxID=1621259 RepID=UPI000855273B|nr:hypothetical protein [Streptomyces sp. NBRC 110611]GAU70419.1 hypothetical protein SSP35_19_00560 [Streptomyces sp. NBRC 110611]